LAADKGAEDRAGCHHQHAVNPAHAVRGPKHVVYRGKTPVLSEEQARRLIG
jgi:hypothetical protein